MNRVIQKKHMKRCAFRKHGGGYELGSPLVPFDVKNDNSFQIKVPVNQSYSDCTIPARPGQLYYQPNPELAQVVMAGGKQRRDTKKRNHSGGKFAGELYPVNTPDSYKVDLTIGQGFPNCGNANIPRTIMAQANPALAQSTMMGGRFKTTRKQKQRGGSRGFAVQPSISVGGNGPNVAALNQPIPCDIRAGSMNPLSHSVGPLDPRAPADLYSATPNQSGGAYSTGNGFSPLCYMAPGSSLPVYPAQTAGFEFRPSTENGGTLPDGVTAYMNVVPRNARLGGARKRKTMRKKNTKH